MLFSLKRAISVIALGACFTLVAPAQEKKPDWKDRAEYDLVDSIGKEANPKTKLGLLNTWKEKYPGTEFKDMRHDLYVRTYQAMGDGKGMRQACQDWIAENPKAFVAYYWLNLLTISLNDNTPPALDLGEKAAKGMLGIVEETFDPSKKAANVTDEQWKKERAVAEANAYKALGWVAMNRNQNEEAEKHFREALSRNPTDALVAYWTGTVIAKQRKFEKQSAALYFFARAANYAGEGALPAEQRKQIQAYLEKTYINFHGDKTGLDEVVTLASANPIPADDFTIKSKQEILQEQEKQLMETNPQLALWVRMKGALTGADGGSYFSQIKDSLVPGGVEVGETNKVKVDKFKATVVSSTPASRPKELVVGISAPDMSEATLRFAAALSAPVPVGTGIEFSGVAADFTPDPFMVIFTVEPEDVTGLPKAAPAKKRPTTAKKAAKK